MESSGNQNQSGNNKNNKGLFPPIINSMMNRASGASQIIQQEENARLQEQQQQNSMSGKNNQPLSMVSGMSAMANGGGSMGANSEPLQRMLNSRVSSPRRSSQAKASPIGNANTPRNSMSTASGELFSKLANSGANSTVPLNNSVGGGAMLESANEVGPKELNGLVDVIMTSDMARPVKRQLLKVILNNIKTITDREDKEIDDMRDKYTAGAYMSSSLMPQVQSQLGMPQSQYGMMPPSPSPYGMPSSPYGMPSSPYGMPPTQYGMPPSPYGMPPYGMMPAGMGGNLAMPYYMGAQQPNMQVEMLGNKINVLQMEMADLTRHLKDYTRRYMDVMREDDMQRIKTYIEELSNVKETVEEAKGLANTMGPTPEELAAEEESANKGLIDKASDTVKNGLATMTNAVNSIGSKLGLVKEPAANNNTTTSANTTPANTVPANTTPAGTTPAPKNTPIMPPTNIAKPVSNNKQVTEEPDSEGENMVDLSDYEIPTSGDEEEPEKPDTSGEDDLDAAIDQLNKASNEALTGGSKPAQPPAQPQVANNKKPSISNSRNQPKPVNTANAVAKVTLNKPTPVSPPKPVMTGGAVDTVFYKTFKKLLTKNKSPKTKKNKSR